jgi:hypothetical protein
VQGVDFCIFGERNLFDQCFGQVFGVLGNFEDGDFSDHIEAFLSGMRIARTALGNDGLRDVQIVSCAMFLPPVACELLIGSGDQISTWP